MAKLPCEVAYDTIELEKQEIDGTTRIFNGPK